jgi:hypothetical protein
MTHKDLSARTVLMLLSESRVLEIARVLGVQSNQMNFGAALAAIEQAGVEPRRLLGALSSHELHFLCVRRSVVPDPGCPREQLIRFLLGEGELDCGAFVLTPPEAPP